MNLSLSRRRRPFGVYAVISLMLLRAIIVAVDLWRVGQGLPPVSYPDLNDDPLTFTLLSAVIVGILIICLGLFLLQRWAWIATMILIGLNLLVAIVDYLNGGDRFFPMLLDVISVFYLNLQGVQAAFQGKTVPPEAPV